MLLAGQSLKSFWVYMTGCLQQSSRNFLNLFILTGTGTNHHIPASGMQPVSLLGSLDSSHIAEAMLLQASQVCSLAHADLQGS